MLSRVGVVATAISFFISAWTLYCVSTEGPIHFILWPSNPESSSVLKIGMWVDRLTASYDGVDHKCQHSSSMFIQFDI